VERQVEGKGKGVQALAGVLHGGEERLVVVLVVRAAVAVAVGSSHLPHYPLILGSGRAREEEDARWRWEWWERMDVVVRNPLTEQSHELLLSSSSLLIYLSRPVPSRLVLTWASSLALAPALYSTRPGRQ
jgi:hypothetical protein